MGSQRDDDKISISNQKKKSATAILVCPSTSSRGDILLFGRMWFRLSTNPCEQVRSSGDETDQ